MDQKKKIIYISAILSLMMSIGLCTKAQKVSHIQFCDRAYEYTTGNDTIRLYLNLKDAKGNRISEIGVDDMMNYLTILEDGVEIVNTNSDVHSVNSGVRIPKEYTFSILLDKTIPTSGKEQILDALSNFVDIAPDSTIYVSMFGNDVSSTRVLTKHNFDDMQQEYMQPSKNKALYSSIYAKLAEFAPGKVTRDDDIARERDYESNPMIYKRSSTHPGKNIMMIFVDGNIRPMDENISLIDVEDFQIDNVSEMPQVHAFYYIEKGDNSAIEELLSIITMPEDRNHEPIAELAGTYSPTKSMKEVVSQFEKVVNDASYDYVFTYIANPDKMYSGNVDYSANWGKETIGNATFTIGSIEKPWPVREVTATSVVVEILVALLVTLLTFGFFFLITKVAVPTVQFYAFKRKYYKKYKPEANVQRRICHYCKQDLMPGQTIVMKCNHWMHDHCWKQNGYKCAEYGQNCKTGIQNHVDRKELFKLSALKDCSQTLAGVLAGLVSWIIYELCGRGGFSGLSKAIVSLVFSPDSAQDTLFNDCVTRTSSFLMIGLLLGFFISLVFRYKDDVRDKNWKVWLKIVGLSVLTAIIGMVAFGIGADIFCLILSLTGKTYIPWYCSLPAYILFSICVSLALTIKSTIPVKSALWGGLCASVIGFLVLYFTKFTSAKYDWLNMLLDFIIYGGGLGASLITVRMLAEKYFLVIQNGVKSGQRIPIHKWMNATGGGNAVNIGMTGDCEIQMNWEKSNHVAKQHAQLSIDHEKMLPVIKPLATGVLFNNRIELPVGRKEILSNGDTFKIGDTIFKYEEA